MGNKTAWSDAIIGINQVQLDRMERDLLKDINWKQIIYKDHSWPQFLWHGTSYTHWISIPKIRIREKITTWNASRFIKVDDKKTRMKWHEILLSDIMTLSKRLKSGWVWLNLTISREAANTDKIIKKWFTQSQKKKQLNWLSDLTQRAFFFWNRANHSQKLCSAKRIKPTDLLLIHSRSEEKHLNHVREIQFRDLLLTLSESNRLLT